MGKRKRETESERHRILTYFRLQSHWFCGNSMHNPWRGMSACTRTMNLHVAISTFNEMGFLCTNPNGEPRYLITPNGIVILFPLEGINNWKKTKRKEIKGEWKRLIKFNFYNTGKSIDYNNVTSRDCPNSPALIIIYKKVKIIKKNIKSGFIIQTFSLSLSYFYNIYNSKFSANLYHTISVSVGHFDFKYFK